MIGLEDQQIWQLDPELAAYSFEGDALRIAEESADNSLLSRMGREGILLHQAKDSIPLEKMNRCKPLVEMLGRLAARDAQVVVIEQVWVNGGPPCGEGLWPQRAKLGAAIDRALACW